MNDKAPPDETFQTSRKRMRAVADLLDILARFEDPGDRLSLVIAVVSTIDATGEKIVNDRMRELYKKGEL